MIDFYQTARLKSIVYQARAAARRETERIEEARFSAIARRGSLQKRLFEKFGGWTHHAIKLPSRNGKLQ